MFSITKNKELDEEQRRDTDVNKRHYGEDVKFYHILEDSSGIHYVFLERHDLHVIPQGTQILDYIAFKVVLMNHHLSMISITSYRDQYTVYMLKSYLLFTYRHTKQNPDDKQ